MQIGEMFVRLGMDMTEYSQGLEDALRVTKSQLADLEGQFKKAGETLTLALTAPLAGIATASLSAFSGFEKAMNRVSVLGEITGQSLDKLKKQAIQLGADTVFSAKEAAEAMSNLAQSGFNANQIFQSMPGTLGLATAGQLNLADATRIAADVLRGFHFDASQMGDVSSAIAKSAVMAGSSVSEMGNAFKYIGPVASAAGISFKEVSAALTILGNAGIRGESAGTALRAMFMHLLNPSKEAAETMRKMGIQVKDASGHVLGLSQILENLSKAGVAAPEKLASGFQVFAHRFSDVLPLITAQAGEFEKRVGDIGKAIEDNFAGATGDAMMKGLAGAWENFKGSVETTAIQIGENLAPAIEKLLAIGQDFMNWLGDLAAKFKELPQGMQTTIIALLALAAAVGPALFLMGSFAGAISNLAPLVSTIRLVGTGLAEFGAVLKAFSITEALTGISASMSAFGATILATVSAWPGMLRNGLTALKMFAADAVLMLEVGLNPANGVLANFGASIVGFFTSLGPKLMAAMAPITAIFASISTAFLEGGIIGVITMLGEAFAGLMAPILALGAPIALIVAAVAALAAVAYVVIQNWEDVKAVLIGVFLDIWNGVKTIFGAIGGWISDMIGPKATAFLKAAWAGMVQWLGGLWEGIKNVFSNGLKYIISALEAVAGALHMENTLKALQDWEKKLDGVKTAAADAGASNAELKRSNEALGASYRGIGVDVDEVTKKHKGLSEAAKQLKKDQEELRQVMIKVADILNSLPASYDAYVKAFAKGHDLPAEWARQYDAITKLKEQFSDLELRMRKAFDPSISAQLKGQLLILDLAIKSQEGFFEKFKMDDVEKSFEKLNGIMASETGPLMMGLSEKAGVLKVAWSEISDVLAQSSYKFASLNEALDEFGLKTQEYWKNAEIKAQGYFDVIKNGYEQGKISTFEFLQAQEQYLTRMIEAEKQLGESWADNAEKLKGVKAQLQAMGDETIKTKNKMTEFAKEVDRVAGRLAQGLADAIFEGKNLGEVFTNVAKEIARALLKYVIEGAIKDLIASLKNAELSTVNLGKVFTDIFGGFGKSAGSVPTPTPGAPTPSAPTTPGAPTGGISGILGIAGSIGSIVSAITDVLSYFQGRRMEKDIGRIEVTTREIKAILGENGQESIFGWTKTAGQSLQGIQDFLWNTFIGSFASLMSTTEECRDRLEDIYNQLKMGIPTTGGGGDGKGGSGGTTSSDASYRQALKFIMDQAYLDTAVLKDALANGKIDQATFDRLMSALNMTIANAKDVSGNPNSTLTQLKQALDDIKLAMQNAEDAANGAATSQDSASQATTDLGDSASAAADALSSNAEAAASASDTITKAADATKYTLYDTATAVDKGWTGAVSDVKDSTDGLTTAVDNTTTALNDSAAASQNFQAAAVDMSGAMGSAAAAVKDAVSTISQQAMAATNDLQSQLDELQKRLDSGRYSDYNVLVNKINSLQQQLGITANSAQVPTSQGVPGFIQGNVLQGEPRTMNLSVTVTGQDANEVASQWITAMRARGVDI